MTGTRRLRSIIFFAIVLAVILFTAVFAVSYAMWEGESYAEVTVEGNASQFYVEYPQYVPGEGAPALQEGEYYLQVQTGDGVSDYYKMADNAETAGEKMLKHVYIKANTVLDMYNGTTQESIKNKKSGAASQFSHPSNNTESPATITADGYYDFYYDSAYRTMYVSYMAAPYSYNVNIKFSDDSEIKTLHFKTADNAPANYNDIDNSSMYIWQEVGGVTTKYWVSYGGTPACIKYVNATISVGKKADAKVIFSTGETWAYQTTDLKLSDYAKNKDNYITLHTPSNGIPVWSDNDGVADAAEPDLTGPTEFGMVKNGVAEVRHATMRAENEYDADKGGYVYRNYICVSRKNGDGANDNSMAFLEFEVDGCANPYNVVVKSINITRRETDGAGTPGSGFIIPAPRLYNYDPAVETRLGPDPAHMDPDPDGNEGRCPIFAHGNMHDVSEGLDGEASDNHMQDHYDDGAYVVLFFGDGYQQYFALDIEIVTEEYVGDFALIAKASNINNWQRFEEGYGKPWGLYMGGLINDVWSWDPRRTTEMTGNPAITDADVTTIKQEGIDVSYPTIAIDYSITLNLTAGSRVKPYLLDETGYRRQEGGIEEEAATAYLIAKKIIAPSDLYDGTANRPYYYIDTADDGSKSSDGNIYIPVTGEYTFRLMGKVEPGYTSASSGWYFNAVTGETRKVADGTKPSGTDWYGVAQFNFIVDELYINSQPASAELNSATIDAPEVNVEVRDGKPYIVIGGGTYDATISGYDMTDATDKAEVYSQLAAAIKELYFFELQHDDDHGALNSNWQPTLTNSHVVNVLDDNKFEVVCNLSSLGLGGVYGTHFVKKVNGSVSTAEGAADFNSTNFPNFTKLESVSGIVGGKKYEAFYNDAAGKEAYGCAWNCLVIAVSKPNPKYAHKTATLETIDGEAYLVIEGTYTDYTEEQFRALALTADYRYDQQLGNDFNKQENFSSDDVTVTSVHGKNSNGTYTVKLKLEEMNAIGKAFFHLAFGNVTGGATDLKCLLKDDAATEAVSGDGKYKYDLSIFIVDYEHEDSSTYWRDGLITVDVSRTLGKAGPVEIKQEGSAVYLVVTGESKTYTAAEIKSLISKLDFEPSHRDKTPIDADLDNVIVEVADGTYTIKYDITTLGAVYDDNAAFGGYWVHLKPFGADVSGDIGNDSGTTPVTVGDRSYAYEYYNYGTWGKHILTIKIEGSSLAAEKAEFVNDGDTVYYAVTFATQKMRLSEIKNLIHHIDFQPAPSGDRIEYSGNDIVFGELGADGKVVVKVDISGLNTGVYVPHYFTTPANEAFSNAVDICVNKPIAAMTVGGMSYEVKETAVTEWNWTAHLIHISQVATVFNVTLDNNYGTAGTFKTISNVEDGKTIDSRLTAAGAPSRTGYTFGGWYKEADCENAWQSTDTVTGNITLYAKWTLVEYTVTFDLNGATGTAPAEQKTDITKEYKITEPSDPERTGYTFGGWYKEAGCTTAWSFAGAVSEPMTLYAKWTLVEYTVTFDLNEAPGTAPVAQKTDITKDYKITAPAEPTRIGYKFTGWITEDGDAWQDSDPITGSITLYANWVSVKVTFKDYDGSVVSGWESVAVGDDGTLDALPVLNREGYDLVGWVVGLENSATEGGDSVDTDYRFDDDTYVWAVWEIKSFDVTFETSGGSKIDKQVVKYGETAVAPANDPTRKGYMFVGWYKNSATSNTAWNFNTDVVTGPTVIYAKWQQATITFNFKSPGWAGINSVKISAVGEYGEYAKVSMSGSEPNYNHKFTIDLDKGDIVGVKVQFNQTGSSWTAYSINGYAEYEYGKTYNLSYKAWATNWTNDNATFTMTITDSENNEMTTKEQDTLFVHFKSGVAVLTIRYDATINSSDRGIHYFDCSSPSGSPQFIGNVSISDTNDSCSIILTKQIGWNGNANQTNDITCAYSAGFTSTYTLKAKSGDDIIATVEVVGAKLSGTGVAYV